MSGWDGYVNAMMKDTGLFDNASILSKESYDEWASTEGFHVRPFPMLLSDVSTEFVCIAH